ncbi:tigger transposable element-derived protein 1-like isoform X2 [Scylla paramamosain]
MPKSTVCTILKNKEAIKAADVAKGVKTLTSQRSKFIEEMEKVLLVWIHEKQLLGDHISEVIICEKAKLLHAKFKRDMPGSSADSEEFKASRGWFENFKKRTGIHTVIHRRVAGSNVNAATSVKRRDVADFSVDAASLIHREVAGSNVDAATSVIDREVAGSNVDAATSVIHREVAGLNVDAATKFVLNVDASAKFVSNVDASAKFVSNVDAAAKFVKKFSEFVNTGGYVAQQVFKCDETGLFWKKMPSRTYITKEEKSLPGHKPIKDRLTLLLCGNASGDCKIKPLLVYHSENPRVFKKNNVMKSKLNVMWRANIKARVTRQFFTEWIHEEFAPSVKIYLEENNLPLKALLVMDNTPAHPPGLEDNLVGEYNFIKVMFLSPNTNPLIQPMHQQVISNFKKLYTKAMFQRCFEVTNETELTLREFWKDHYNILHCLRIIDKAWREVSPRTMNYAWKKLWPECVTGRDSESFEELPVVPAIVCLGRAMGLEVSENDVEELVEDHKNELTKEELQDLLKMQQEEVAQEISLEEEGNRNITSAEIKELCFLWSKTQAIVEKWHPNKAVVNKSINLFNDNVIDYFRKIQK